MKKNILTIYLLMVIVLFSFTSSAYALKLSNPYPSQNSEIYLNPYPNNKINISIDCAENTTNIKTVYAELYDSNGFIGSYALEQTSNTTCSTLSPPLNPGAHSVKFYCEDNATNITTQVNFTLYSIAIDIDTPTESNPETVYREGKLSVSFDFNKITDSQEIITNPDNFRVFLSGTEVSISQADYWINTTTGKWNIQTSVPDSFSFGSYDLKIEGTYQGHTVSDTENNAVAIKYPLSVDIVSPTYSSPQAFVDGGQFAIKAKILYKSEVIGTDKFGINDFSVLIGDNIYTPDSISRDETDTQYWNIKVSTPKYDPGSYDLTLSVTYDGNTVSSKQEDAIQFVLPFKGTLIDAGGKIIGARIIFEDTGKTIRTDNLGVYELSPGLVPGTYNLRIEFEDGKTIARFKGVEINKNTPDMNRYPYTIRYDRLSGTPANIEGVSVAKTVVLEFGLPFQNAEVTISYDDVESKIMNQMNIEVFACHNWNFAARRCAGQWEKIPSNVDTILNIISFNATELSAFIIGERKSLKMDVNLDVKEYTLGEPIQIKGKVTDTSSNPIEDAVIKFSIAKGNITTTTKTTFGGFYVGEISAPMEEGIFNITIEAVKEPYIGYKASLSLQAVKSKSLSFIGIPDTTDIYLDTPQDIKFTLLNSGQTALTDIRLYIVGISTNWYQLIPQAINELQPGESKEITLKINVPTQDCISGACKTYYSITIQAKSNEIEKESVLTATLKQKVVQQKETKPQEWFNFEALTGQLTGSEPVFYMGMSVIIIIIFTVLIIRKKKINVPKRRTPRQDILFSFQSLKPHIFSKPQVKQTLREETKKEEEEKKEESLDEIIEELE